MALMMGTAACGPCHQAVERSYQQSAHFLTSGSANSTTIHGSFLEGRNVLLTAVPGVYFRMLFIGFFEGLGSQRAFGWRCADSLSVRDFSAYRLAKRLPIIRA